MCAVGFAKSTLLKPFRSLHTIKIFLPSKKELAPVPRTAPHRGALGTLKTPSASPVVQDPSAPAPRVVHHDSVEIPEGFNCGLCRPATDGPLVYLLARTKERFFMALGAYTFWIFVYNWKTGHGLQMRLPEVFFKKAFTFLPFRLMLRIARMAVGGRLRGRDTQSSSKIGRMRCTPWICLPSLPRGHLRLRPQGMRTHPYRGD